MSFYALFTLFGLFPLPFPFPHLLNSLISHRRRREPRQLPPEKIIQHHLRHGINIRFAALEQPPRFSRQELQELRRRFVLSHLIQFLYVPSLRLLQHRVNILGRIFDVLDPHYASEKDVAVAIAATGRDHAGAVDQVNAFHEGDVLPYFRFAGYGSHGADLFLAQGVDDGGFARVGVADEADGDLLAVGMQGGELAEELD